MIQLLVTFQTSNNISVHSYSHHQLAMQIIC